jgi:hypothetical protein
VASKIILFELNEVPYRVIDDFCVARPGSALARVLPHCRQFETYTEDLSNLSPWKTWPSLHRGVPDVRHLIHDFGQELSSVDREYPPLWRLLAEHGVPTGVCGSLHTYPVPTDLNGYTFFIPDTFAAGSECFPKTLDAFQRFNVGMVSESTRNVDTHVPWASALRLLAAAPDLGLKPATFGQLAGQLVGEKLQGWRTTRRRSYQAVLAFDVFMRQLERTQPAFATFFTNHVASSMHRYWAATYPQDYETFGFDRSWVDTYRDEIDFTMGKFDAFVARLVRFVDLHPGYALWVATSMGQAATQAHPIETTLYATDVERLAAGLGASADAWSRMPSMRPQVNLRVSEREVAAFRASLSGLSIDGVPVVFRESEKGFFSIDFGQENLHLKPEARATLHGRPVAFEALGLSNIEIEDKSGTTAYHVPQGALIIYDPADHTPRGAVRPQVSTLELAPSLLQGFGVPVPAYMRRPAPLGAP